MRAAKWGLTVVLGALSMTSIGVGEAWSQNSFLVACNRSGIDAWVAVTAHPNTGDSRYLISGWYRVNSGSCQDLYYVGRGWVYFYAESQNGDIYWSGNAQRFCVNYPGPFDRYISDAYNCSGAFLKSFIGYYVDVGTFTWTMN